MVMGESGSGKSRSIKNLDPATTGIFNVSGKPMPFRSKGFKVLKTSRYPDIMKVLGANKSKVYVVDDAQYLMAFESLSRAYDQGYGKWTEMGKHFVDLVRFVIDKTTDDTLVFFLQHTDTSDDGKVKAKTMGKMIDNWIKLEGLFAIVILCQSDDTGHWFVTQNSGNSTAKSPEEMFPEKMDNDLAEVVKKINEYYGFEESAND